MYLIRLLEQPRFSALRFCNPKALKWQMSLLDLMYFLAQYYVAVGCFMWSRTSKSRAEFLFCCQQLMWMNLLYFICEGCKRRGRGGSELLAAR
jgi:hypothetical protein